MLREPLNRVPFNSAAWAGLGATRASILLMFGSAASFAAMSACARGLQGLCDWRVVAATRAVLAFGFTLAVARAVRAPFVWPGPRTLWVRSLVGSAGMLCTFFALTRLPVSRSVTLLNSFPIWVAALSWPVLGLRPTRATILAVACGLLGVQFLARGPDAGGAPPWPAVAAALAASVCTAVVMLGLHRLRTLNPLSIASHFALISSVACLAYVIGSWFMDRSFDPFASSDAGAWALLAGTGLFATLGQIQMTTAFRYGPPDKLAPVGLSQSAFALVLDIALWRQPLDAPLALGMILVLAPGVWLVLRRPAGEPLADPQA